jgi:hypothetical protein
VKLEGEHGICLGLISEVTSWIKLWRLHHISFLLLVAYLSCVVSEVVKLILVQQMVVLGNGREVIPEQQIQRC